MSFFLQNAPQNSQSLGKISVKKLAATFLAW